MVDANLVALASFLVITTQDDGDPDNDDCEQDDDDDEPDVKPTQERLR